MILLNGGISMNHAILKQMIFDQNEVIRNTEIVSRDCLIADKEMNIYKGMIAFTLTYRLTKIDQ